MPPAKKKPEAPLPEKFEDAMDELESIVTDMEEAELPLEQLIDKYGRGMKLAAFCEGKLGQAEKQVEVLTSGPAKTDVPPENNNEQEEEPEPEAAADGESEEARLF